MNKYEQMDSEFKADNLPSLSINQKRKKKSLPNLSSIIIFSCIIIMLSLIFAVISKRSKLQYLTSLNSHYNETIAQLTHQNHILNLNISQLTIDEEKLQQQTTKLNELMSEYSHNLTIIMDESFRLNHQIDQMKRNITAYSNQQDSLHTEIISSGIKFRELQKQSETLEKEINDLRIQEKINNNIKGQRLIDQVIESKIATSPNEVIYIKNMFAFPEYIELKLLYRKSDDSYSAQKFHDKCDKAQMTLVLLHLDNNGHRFKIGGYTSRSWGQHSKSVSWVLADNTAFLFSLTDEIVHLIRQKTKAIICDEQHLAFFNYDLQISEFGIKTIFPSTYGYSVNENSLTKGKELILPNEVVEIEVFEVVLK